jgi:putative addiction module component (TIGR02574 family)
MTKKAILEAAQQLPVEDQAELLDALWDSVLENSPPELTDEEKRIIDGRLKLMEENPDSGIPWEEAKKMIRKMP